MKIYRAMVIKDNTNGDYDISFPSLPGCFSNGENMDEVIDNAKEALSSHLDKSDISLSDLNKSMWEDFIDFRVE